MDNMLIQVTGVKKIIFFPPSDIDFLYMRGDKSEIIDVENTDLTAFPLFAHAQKYETDLEPGDIVVSKCLIKNC